MLGFYKWSMVKKLAFIKDRFKRLILPQTAAIAGIAIARRTIVGVTEVEETP